MNEQPDFNFDEFVTLPNNMTSDYTFEDFLKQETPITEPLDLHRSISMASTIYNPELASPFALYSPPADPTELKATFSPVTVKSESAFGLFSPPTEELDLNRADDLDIKKTSTDSTLVPRKRRKLPESEKLQDKRRRNTESARRSRLKKLERVQELERRIEESEKTCELLSQQVEKLKQEKLAWTLREQQLRAAVPYPLHA